MRAYYDYTYYRPRHKRYSYMTGNDVEYTYGTSGNETGRFLFWTEDSRLHTVADFESHSYYAYDHGGERTLKLTGKNTVLDVNAEQLVTSSTLDEVTLYPSPYVVVTNKGYTKHYYVGGDRLCAWNPVKLVDPDGREWDPASKGIIDDFRRVTENEMNNAETNEMRLKYQQVLDELYELDLSSQVYHVEKSLGRDGHISYDLSDDCVSIQYDGKNYNLAHELKHAYQFEKSELSFSAKTGGWSDIVCDEGGKCINRVLLYDLTDEVAAYQRGELYGGPIVIDEYIANRYSFGIEGSNRRCYPFLWVPTHGPNNIYLGCDTPMSLPPNANPDQNSLKDNIFRLNGKTYKK